MRERKRKRERCTDYYTLVLCMCTYKREGGREGRVLLSVSLIYTCTCMFPLL